MSKLGNIRKGKTSQRWLLKPVRFISYLFGMWDVRWQLHLQQRACLHAHVASEDVGSVHLNIISWSQKPEKLQHVRNGSRFLILHWDTDSTAHAQKTWILTPSCVQGDETWQLYAFKYTKGVCVCVLVHQSAIWQEKRNQSPEIKDLMFCPELIC